MAELKEGVSGTGAFSGAGGARVLKAFADKVGGEFGAKLKGTFLEGPQSQPQNTGSSSNMIQSSAGSNGGLAASAVGAAPQPTLTSGVQNPIADSTQFGNRTNGLGVMDGLAGSSFRNNFQNNQGMQNQYGIIGGASLI